jgi:hypothetical protein
LLIISFFHYFSIQIHVILGHVVIIPILLD